MEALLKEISDILKAKNERISLLEWVVKNLEKENEDLKNDIEKYKENEVNKV